MGCDIHLFVEVRDGAGKPWELCPVTWKQAEPAPQEEYAGFDWRNYDVFAILANVRNGVGFAGVETGSGFNFIAEPRGLPADMSAQLRDIAENAIDFDEDRTDALKSEHGAWWLGEHSHSHVTLGELLDFNWNQRTNHSGVVEAAQFKVFQDEGQPVCYAGEISGGTVRRIPNALMAKFVAACRLVPDYRDKYHGETIEHVEWTAALAREMKEYSITPQNWRQLAITTRVQWSESYKESVAEFYTGFIPALARLAQHRRLDDVRIVFGFDS